MTEVRDEVIGTTVITRC